MECIRFFLTGAAVCVCASLCSGQAAEVKDSIGTGVRDTTGASTASVPQVSEPAGRQDSLKVPKRYNPAIALTCSMIIPGAGQAYTRHYVKAGLFLIAEAGVGLFGYERYIWQKGLKSTADSVSDLAAKNAGKLEIRVIDSTHADTTYPGVALSLETDRDRFDVLAGKYVVYQSISWMAGIYYYNILDALHATGCFKDDSKKTPATAGWLSAIPALGLGQFYNGETGKAGMIFMTQFNLGFLAYNYQRLMRVCEDHEVAALKDSLTYATYTSKGFGNDWENRRKDAFRNRNMYLWYSLIFYFYGILDAVVDAHLHDAGMKLKLEPDLVPQNKQVGLTLTMPF
jgi:hypothetical protein